MLRVLNAPCHIKKLLNERENKDYVRSYVAMNDGMEDEDRLTIQSRADELG